MMEREGEREETKDKWEEVDDTRWRRGWMWHNLWMWVWMSSSEVRLEQTIKGEPPPILP